MDPTYSAAYEESELTHWWWVARRELVQWHMARFFPPPQSPRWLDIGCCTGVLLASVPQIKNKMGLELDAASVARGRAKGLEIHQAAPRWDLTPYGTFDLITLCDVIEHVEQDQDAISAIYQALNPGGIALVTVPALPGLWSAHDVRNYHYRRYVKPQLGRLFADPRWEILKLTYFSSLLLPAIWSIRQLNRLRYGDDPARTPDDRMLGSSTLNALLLTIFRQECRLLRWTNMPLGSSLLLVARRAR